MIQKLKYWLFQRGKAVSIAAYGASITTYAAMRL